MHSYYICLDPMFGEGSSGTTGCISMLNLKRKWHGAGLITNPLQQRRGQTKANDGILHSAILTTDHLPRSEKKKKEEEEASTKAMVEKGG